MSEVDAALSRLGLGALVESRGWSTLGRASHVATLSAGSVLWRAGAPATHLFVVLSGRVRIVRSHRGRQHLVHVARPGDSIGEVPVLDGAGYPATAIAAEPTECLAMPADLVLELLERDGALARIFLQRLANRVRVLVDRLAGQTLGDVRSRLAGSLVGLAVAQESDTIRLPRPQAEWAEDLGTVRETLAREIGRLVERGVVAREGRGRIRVVDAGTLEAIALGRDDA